MLLFLSLASAAEPALDKPRIAIGAGLMSGASNDGVSSPTMGAGIRLHLGRATCEVEGGLGHVSEDVSYADYAWDDEEGVELYRYTGTELSGLAGAVGLRFSWTVTRRAPVAIGLGFHGGYEVRGLSGPLFEEGPDSEIMEVGFVEERSWNGSVGPSLVATVWMTERLSLSGFLDVDVWGVYSNSTVATRTDEDTDYESEVDERYETTLGAWPHAGLYVHLLL